MQVFVLCTGRCGSMTFIHACQHMTNFTAGHESRWGLLFGARLCYPQNHIESDNRLSWCLGGLNEKFGEQAYYVHLLRDREATARSFARRIGGGPGSIVRGYQRSIVRCRDEDPLEVCRDYVDTVTQNISMFLADKPHVLTVRLEQARRDFRRFWRWIDASGDLDAAMAEWDTRYNASV